MPTKAKSKKPKDGGMDWAAFDALTDEEVLKRAKSDPDAQPLAEDQLAKMKRATPVRKIRFKLRMTQSEFSAAFRIPMATLRSWERGEVDLDPVIRAYLSAIERAPDAIRKALKHKKAA